ncbi:hypothetical protein ASE35_03345 [Lysobacter sp. Root916]|uniref:sialate O-acetylesterase n=1 Tax=Lysobacter sp. Root916 TaxID=1736606 RepID=UPI00070F2E32|nr:sialate O-acetylesterase [Lysobacter sp. Root916]KRD39405.1 hypothetical protein ASE35_03345 [Lysobacter sp. Root916]
MPLRTAATRARRLSGLLLSLCVLGASLGAHAQAPVVTLRTYIVAGQSNAEGFGIRNIALSAKNNTDQDRYINSVVPKQDLYTIGFGTWDSTTDQALIYKAHPSTGVAPGWDAMRPHYGYYYEQYLHHNNMFGPELAIGREVSTHLGERIAIIKYTLGGSPISMWDPDDPAQNLYDHLLAAVNNGKNAIAPANIALDIQGVFWMQGEADSIDQARAQAYEANLKKFVAALRRDLNKPQLDVYVATIKDTPYLTYRQQIWNAQQTVADADPNVYLVHGRDLETYTSDPIHYTARGQVSLGQRFALQALYDAWGLGQVAW